MLLVWSCILVCTPMSFFGGLANQKKIQFDNDSNISVGEYSVNILRNQKLQFISIINNIHIWTSEHSDMIECGCWYEIVFVLVNVQKKKNIGNCFKSEYALKVKPEKRISYRKNAFIECFMLRYHFPLTWNFIHDFKKLNNTWHWWQYLIYYQLNMCLPCITNKYYFA